MSRRRSPAPAVRDPFERFNRAMFAFNDKVYLRGLAPAGRAYARALPESVRVGVRNFFSTVTTPVRLANKLAQGKFREAGREAARFAINATLGFGGFVDAAKERFGLEFTHEDLGRTLARYGVGHGAYLVLPLWGALSLRDLAGMSVDFFLDPIHCVGEIEAIASVRSYKGENKLSLHLGEYEAMKAASDDPYAEQRERYIRHRAAPKVPVAR
jgi:phospholipid-binding lipoprotein MlaA